MPRKALEGFTVTERRGVDNGEPERDGVEIVERIDGCEHVFRMVNGNKVLIRRAGHEVERLEHRFEACPTCGQQHMLIGPESLEPGDCPRTGWSWTTGAPPRYPTGGSRTLQTVSAEARSFNEGMVLLEREVRRG